VGLIAPSAAHGSHFASDEGFIAIVRRPSSPTLLRDHLLDFMVAHYGAHGRGSRADFRSLRLLWRQPGTVAIMTDGRLPYCDLGEAAGRAPCSARYDAQRMDAAGPSCVRLLCARGVTANSVFGLGQRLVTGSEIPPEVPHCLRIAIRTTGSLSGWTLPTYALSVASMRPIGVRLRRFPDRQRHDDGPPPLVAVSTHACR